MYIKVIDLTGSQVRYLPCLLSLPTFASPEEILRHLLLFACRHICAIYLYVCVSVCVCVLVRALQERSINFNLINIQLAKGERELEVRGREREKRARHFKVHSTYISTEFQSSNCE